MGGTKQGKGKSTPCSLHKALAVMQLPRQEVTDLFLSILTTKIKEEIPINCTIHYVCDSDVSFSYLVS